MNFWENLKERVYIFARYTAPTCLFLRYTVCKRKGHEADAWLCFRCFKEFQ
jgi:hypothetical protein